PFTSAYVSSNGNLQFSSTNAAFFNTTLPAAGFLNTIFAHWDDLWTAAAPGCVGYAGNNCGIFTRVSGVAPNRTFCIEWRAVYFNNPNQRANFTITLSEGQDTFRISYGTVQQGGISATVGAQKDATLFTQYSFNTWFIFPSLQLT